MPLLSHAAAGIGAGILAEGLLPSRGEKIPFPSPLFPVRTGLAVLLSYAPDLAEQAASLAGGGIARHGAAHSVPAALACGLLLAPLFRLLRTPWRASAAAGVAATLSHVLLDLLFSPLPDPSHRPGAGEGALLPFLRGGGGDGALFALLLALSAAGAFVLRRRRGAAAVAPSRPARLAATAGYALSLLVVAAAAVTFTLRSGRELDLEEGRRLVEAGRWEEGLRRLETADRWPSTNRPGRAEELRGEAWRGLGRNDLARRHYLRSLEEDPSYFWALIDLASLDAAGEEPAEVRRMRARRWLDRLDRDFPGNDAAAEGARRIRARLGEGAGGAGSVGDRGGRRAAREGRGER
jgi:membrane-bound metal-dependent hydrolase YbcI (DUF457 family)